MNPRASRLTRNLAVAITGAGLALGAVACNDDVTSTSSPTATATATVTATATATAASSAAARASAPAKPTAAGTARASDRCHTGDLRADIQLQLGGTGSAMVMLVNKSARTCTVDGYLGYGGLLADNSRVTVPTTRSPYPGPPSLITLKPGTTAFSGLKWSTCDKGDVSCKVLAGVVVTPPDETTQLTANVLGLDGAMLPQLLVSSAGFIEGSLQPSNEGVVFSS